MWPYRTPGIPDDRFESLPGIPLTKREIRLLIISALRLKDGEVFWDIGAGTGTIPVEMGLLCPGSAIIAIERDEEVASLIRRNGERFGVKNITVYEGNAPDCLDNITPAPDRVCIEGGKPVKALLQKVWHSLNPDGRIVATANNLETLYQLSEGFSDLQARNIEIVQAAVNRVETRGRHQILAAVDPIFILSGDKL